VFVNGRVERGEAEQMMKGGGGLVVSRFLVGELSSARRIALTAIFFDCIFHYESQDIYLQA